MSYIIIGVHGLSKKPKPDTLARGWSSAISEGIEVLQGLNEGQVDVNYEMVDWIDLYYDERDTSTANRYRRAAKGKIQRYNDRWRDAARGMFGDAVDKPLQWLKKRGLFTDAADKVLAAYIKDLDKYYKNKTKREKTRDLVMEAIKRNTDKRIMLIGHSMGSIITYDVLRLLGRENANHRIEHYITIGSPLGLPHVQNQFIEEFGNLRTPSIVHQWSNFADKFDPVALDNHLRRDFKPNSRGVRPEDDIILNDWGGINHKSYGYLRCPEVAETIAGFI